MNKIKLVCFDLDGTLITENSWFKLNIALGITAEEDKKMSDSYLDGYLKYEDWIKELVTLYKEKGKANIKNVSNILLDYRLKDDAEEIVSYLKQKDYIIVILSGSFDLLVDDVANKLDIKYRKGNTTFQFDDSGELVDLISGGEEKYVKLDNLKSLCNKLRIELAECACVGDGSNDLELFRATGNGITFNASSKDVKKETKFVINSLSEIKTIL